MTRGWRETDTVAATPLSAMIYKQNINKNNGKFKEKKLYSTSVKDLDLNPHGSGSRRAKSDQQRRKKLRNFMF
jgi:hypothetical protein